MEEKQQQQAKVDLETKLKAIPELAKIDQKYWTMLNLDCLRLFLFLKMVDSCKPQEIKWEVKEQEIKEWRFFFNQFKKEFKEFEEKENQLEVNKQNTITVDASNQIQLNSYGSYEDPEAYQLRKQIGNRHENKLVAKFFKANQKWRDQEDALSIGEYAYENKIVSQELAYQWTRKALLQWEENYKKYIDAQLQQEQGKEKEVFAKIEPKIQQLVTISGWRSDYLRRIKQFLHYSLNWIDQWPQQYQNKQEYQWIISQLENDIPFENKIIE